MDHYDNHCWCWKSWQRSHYEPLDLININAKIIRSMVKEVARYAPDCKLMIVTNPVDVMTFVARGESDLPPKRVFGYGKILDTLRFRSYIAHELGVSRQDTQALAIDKHGESMFPMVEYASVSGIPVTTPLSKKSKLRRL